MRLDLEPATLLYLDLFPAVIDVGETELGDELRVAVTDNHLYILAETPDGAELIVKEPVVKFSGTNKTGYSVQTDTATYHIFRAPNCGCGASLRGITLFPDAVYVRPS